MLASGLEKADLSACWSRTTSASAGTTAKSPEELIKCDGRLFRRLLRQAIVCDGGGMVCVSRVAAALGLVLFGFDRVFMYCLGVNAFIPFDPVAGWVYAGWPCCRF